MTDRKQCVLREISLAFVLILGEHLPEHHDDVRLPRHCDIRQTQAVLRGVSLLAVVVRPGSLPYGARDQYA